MVQVAENRFMADLSLDDFIRLAGASEAAKAVMASVFDITRNRLPKAAVKFERSKDGLEADISAESCAFIVSLNAAGLCQYVSFCDCRTGRPDMFIFDGYAVKGQITETNRAYGTVKGFGVWLNSHMLAVAVSSRRPWHSRFIRRSSKE